jgi:RNA polymerase sigma factor (sigma-70 family)
MSPSARPLTLALECARAAAGCRQTRPADADLLARFAGDRDGDAFAELVRRHGPLVFGVARRRLADRHAAEDVVQGTFLALARQAGRLRDDTVLPGWLHTVAYRLARKAQTAIGRRPVPRLPDDTASPTADPLAQVSGRELIALIDAELARLPVLYRLPLILCGLEGLTRDEAAARLGWTVGALRGRLERGRELLRSRLAARGLTVPAVLAGALLATSVEAMPASLVRVVTRAAIAAPPAAMPVKLLIVAAVAMTLGVGTGVALMPGGQPTPKANPPAPTAVGPVAVQPRVDAEGVPLPPEALARLGSSRMRHVWTIRSVAQSPDGRLVASADGGGGLRTWDAASGKLVRRWDFRGSDDPLSTLMGIGFNTDGRQLHCVTFGKQVLLRTLDLESGQELRRTEMRGEQFPDCVAFARNGRFVAASWGDKFVRLHDTATGREILKFPFTGFRVMGMAFSADARTLAVADLRDALALYDTATGELTGELKHEGLSFNRVALSPDGQSAITMATHDHGMVQLQFWDVPGRKLQHHVGSPSGYTEAVAFSPDSRLALSTSPSGPCILWDAATGQEARRLPGFRGGLAAAFSADGQTVAVGSNSAAVTMWDAETGKLRPASADPVIGPWGLRFSADGKQLSGVGIRPFAWDVATARPISWFADMQDSIRNIALSPDEEVIAVSGDRVTLLDSASGRELRQTRSEKVYPSVLLFTDDGRRLICNCSDDESIRVFDVATGAEAWKLTGHAASPDRMAVSPDGRWLASASTEGYRKGERGVRVWDLAAGREARQFVLPDSAPRGELAIGFAFSPDGNRLAVLGRPPTKDHSHNSLQVWDMTTGRAIRTADVNASWGYDSIVFTPDGRSLIFGGGEGAVRLWEIASGGERHSFAGHAGYIQSVAISPDGRTAASASNEAPVYLWDVYGRSDPHSPPTADDLNQCWTDLAATDAAVAFRSIRRLIAAPDAAVNLLRDHIKPATPPDAERVKQSIASLNSPKFTERQAAAKELDAVADRAADQLRATLTETKSAEVRQALQTILDRLDAAPPELLRALRSVEVLEQIATPAAREQLKTWAGGAPAATLTRAAADAIKRLDRP